MTVGECIVGQKHKPAERTAIHDPENNDLLTDGKTILAATLREAFQSTKRGNLGISPKWRFPSPPIHAGLGLY